MEIKLNEKNPIVYEIQKALVQFGYSLIVNGIFDRLTENLVKRFQLENKLKVDGIVGEITAAALGILKFFVTKRNNNDIEITEQQYKLAADDLGVEVAVIKAIDEVESAGDGFTDDGNVKILFEPHIFWRELKKNGKVPEKYVNGNDDILYPKWKKGTYGKVSQQWSRLDRAMKIDEQSALASASWGKFQIMGFNYIQCGFKTLNAFVDAMKLNEYEHLKAFVNFVKHNKLDKYLIAKDWAKFAERYNGAGYKLNKYDTRLAKAYEKFLVDETPKVTKKKTKKATE